MKNRTILVATVLLLASTLSLSTLPVRGLVLAFEESFYTNSDGQPLNLDASGNPMVDALIRHSRRLSPQVIGTDPGQVLAWVKLTNAGDASLDSFQIRETLPVDWLCDGCPDPDSGLFSFNVGVERSLSGTGFVEVDAQHYGIITDLAHNPQTVSLSIPDLAASSAGASLGHGDSLLVSITMTYALKGTSQDPTSYPRTHTDTWETNGYVDAFFAGEHTSQLTSASFVAYARVLGGGGGHAAIN